MYTPSVVLGAAGGSSAKLEVVMPSPGPESVKGEYIDCFWLRDQKTDKVIAAQTFKASNQLINGKKPSFAARVAKGTTVIPMVHTNLGGTWEGSPLAIK